MSIRSRLFLFFYYVATTLVVLPGLLFLVWKKRKDPGYGSRVFELLGLYKTGLRNCIWFHTVSVGEAIAARPLITAFVKRHPKLPILVTTTTTTGAKEILKIDGITHVYAPLDCPLCVWLFYKNFRPKNLFIMETELWPSMLSFSKLFKTKVSVFNARMPEKTCHKYEKHKVITRDIIANRLSKVICQTKDDADRFRRIGVSDDRIITAGSLKYDLTPNEPLFRRARAIHNLKPDLQYVGAISTHEGEESMIIETFYSLQSKFPNLRLVLVPRHQSGVSRAENFLDDISGSYALRTCLKSDLSDFSHDILIGNTMGEIEFYLGMCDIVVMGGSFIDIGGHNPLEPAYFSLPIITGPYYYNFTEQFENLIEHGAAFVANDHRRLYNICKMFLNDPDLMLKSGMTAFDIQQQGRGAVNKTLDAIEECLRS